jgi:hypothetical protein
MDINRDSYNMGLPFTQEAGVEHKIDFQEGPAMGYLDALLLEVCSPVMRYRGQLLLKVTISWYTV